MSQLPARGEYLGLEGPDHELREVLVVALDKEQHVWVTRDTATGELLLMQFDEALNWSYINISTSEDSA